MPLPQYRFGDRPAARRPARVGPKVTLQNDSRIAALAERTHRVRDSPHDCES